MENITMYDDVLREAVSDGDWAAVDGEYKRSIRRLLTVGDMEGLVDE